MLSNDPLEIYDFPYDFNTFLTSLNNKLAFLKTKISADVIRGVIASSVGKMGTPGTEGFRRISKSRFGEDNMVSQESIDTQYAFNLVLLKDKLSQQNPVVADIIALVNQINTADVSSKLNYNIVLSGLNATISRKGLTGVPLLNISATATTSPLIAAGATATTRPLIYAGGAGSSGDLVKVLMYSVLAIFVLIVLIFIFNYLKKKKYL